MSKEKITEKRANIFIKLTEEELDKLINVVGFDCQRTRAELGKEPHIDIKTAYDKLKHAKPHKNE